MFTVSVVRACCKSGQITTFVSPNEWYWLKSSKIRRNALVSPTRKKEAFRCSVALKKIERDLRDSWSSQWEPLRNLLKMLKKLAAEFSPEELLHMVP